MPSITGTVIAAGIGAAGSLASAGIGASAASNAANTQAAAEAHAADVMHEQYLQTRSDLLPYNTGGQGDFAAYNKMGPFSFAPTMAQIENTPGYRFNLDQGLKSTQNSAAARGLGVSGAALKGAAQYSQGLAGTQYQNLFNNALEGYQANTNKLLQGATLGENAAVQTGSYGTTTAGNIGATIVGAGNAQAAGQVGVSNALQGGFNGLTNAAYLGLAGGGLFGGGGGGGQSGAIPGGLPDYLAAGGY